MFPKKKKWISRVVGFAPFSKGDLAGQKRSEAALAIKKRGLGET